MFTKLGLYIIALEPISTAYLINPPTSLRVCIIYRCYARSIITSEMNKHATMRLCHIKERMGLLVEVEVEVTLWLTVSQYVLVSNTLAGLRPDIICCRNVVWNLRSYIYGAPSLTRGRVCNLLYNHSMVRVAQNAKPYFTVSSESPPTWMARFPYLYRPGTGWPSYTPGHWVPFTSSLTTRRARVEVF
jgi:hypothetical protein